MEITRLAMEEKAGTNMQNNTATPFWKPIPNEPAIPELL
jgi:hypothetical protein